MAPARKGAVRGSRRCCKGRWTQLRRGGGEGSLCRPFSYTRFLLHRGVGWHRVPPLSRLRHLPGDYESPGAPPSPLGLVRMGTLPQAHLVGTVSASLCLMGRNTLLTHCLGRSKGALCLRCAPYPCRRHPNPQGIPGATEYPTLCHGLDVRRPRKRLC